MLGVEFFIVMLGMFILSVVMLNVEVTVFVSEK
jgi:hypothetical protein